MFAMREKCPYFPASGLHTDQKNSKYGHFSRIVGYYIGI